jgi:peptidoglycan/xylan/chitin deacetylase (PgdA/CDA1 family)
LTGSSAVALTFDDGPDPVYTPQMLDLLKEHGVPATFTVIGSRARDYPDVIRRIAADGHTLCNHSWQHLIDLGARDFGYQSWDLKSTNYAIQAAVPGLRVKYFRAPGGNFTQGLIDLATSIGMTPIYWDVDPRDWDAATYGHGDPMVRHIVRVVQQTVRPGSIVLSHDRVRPDTITAYRTLLPWLKARYELVRLP